VKLQAVLAHISLSARILTKPLWRLKCELLDWRHTLSKCDLRGHACLTAIDVHWLRTGSQDSAVRLGAHPGSYSMGRGGFLPKNKAAKVWMVVHLQPAQRLRMYGAVPPVLHMASRFIQVNLPSTLLQINIHHRKANHTAHVIIHEVPYCVSLNVVKYIGVTWLITLMEGDMIALLPTPKWCLWWL